MREILFRGKTLKTNKWVYGSCNLENTLASISGCAVIPKTIGQYTGLKDLHGTRIFAGDIVKTKYGRLCEVRWVSSPCSRCWDLIPIEATQKAPDSYDVWASKNLEVVGNVHDGGAYD